MKRYYGAVVAEPQGVTIKDNSTGVFGFGRSSITSVSLVADSIYDQVIPEIYTDSEMPVNCKVAAGRDESDFYEALGIVGEGPLISYTAAHYEDLNGNPVAMGSTGAVFVGSTLDGQAQHGWPNQPTYGIRQVLGADPAADGDWFSLDQSGNTTGGDWRKVFSGNSTFKDNYAAGTAFLVIRRSDTKGLQLTKPGDHAMVAYVQMGMSGWVWTSPGVRVFGPPLVNPVWIAINMLLRARGLRLGANATTAQLNLAETFFDVQAAIDAAAVCNQQVTALVGAGSETQFKFRGVLQEEKPLRDWLQEVLMNCLGYYTFSFGKLKIGVRVNSSTVEAFTIGNIVFNSLQLAPLKPSFDHLTANFADQDYKFVNNSVTVYDIDRATLLGGAAGPLFLKSNVNLSGTCTKSQAARIISIRLREELGGTSIAEWKAARQLVFRTTVLALNTEPGMVCSMTHPDMPGGAGEFRVSSWKLNKDYSIDIQGRTTTDSMYDLVAGPKPADVVATPVPDENLQDTGVPGVVLCTPTLTDYGTYVADNIVVQPDASGNTNVVGATEITLGLYYVDELATDLWASIDAAMNAATDPATVNCTVNPNTTRVFRVGDFVVFNDEAADANHAGRRSYECAQIVGPRQHRRRGPHWRVPVPAGVPGRRSGVRHLRDAHLLPPGRDQVLQARLEDVHLRGQEGLLPDARPAAARRGEDPLRVRRGGAGRRGEPLRLRAVHGLSAEPSQRALHARRPHLLRRRLHVPDPRIARGAGQRRDPAEGAERRFDPVRLCIPPARDQRWPVGLRREVLDRWRHDVERAGEDGHRAEHRDAVQEHLGFPRGAGLRQAGDAPPAV